MFTLLLAVLLATPSPPLPTISEGLTQLNNCAKIFQSQEWVGENEKTVKKDADVCESAGDLILQVVPTKDASQEGIYASAFRTYFWSSTILASGELPYCKVALKLKDVGQKYMSLVDPSQYQEDIDYVKAIITTVDKNCSKVI